jgi:beta-lactamase class A
VDLEPQLRGKINSFNGKVGLYIKDLTNGQEISINGNEPFPTASTSKLIVAMAAYKSSGRNPGSLSANMPQLVSDMIVYSSNGAFGELVEQLGSPTLEKTCRELDLRSTAIHNEPAYQKTGYHSISTARDMGKALENLLSGRYIGNNNSKTILRLMEKGIYNDEIPRLLPKGTPVAHKPGELHDIICDVGIVFNKNRTYLIAVYTKTDEGSSAASNFIASISAMTDKYFSALPPRSLPKSLRKNIP